MTTPSTAQARLIARLWGEGRGIPIQTNGYIDPTVLACVKRGWLSPTDERGTHPHGDEFIGYDVSLDGLRALARSIEKGSK